MRKYLGICYVTSCKDRIAPLVPLQRGALLHELPVPRAAASISTLYRHTGNSCPLTFSFGVSWVWFRRRQRSRCQRSRQNHPPPAPIPTAPAKCARHFSQA